MHTDRPSVYVAAAPRTGARPDRQPQGDEQDALRTLARMAMGGGISGLRDMESALISYGSDTASGRDDAPYQDAARTIQTLKGSGYVRDDKRWLTRRGFEAVGRVLLRDIMRDLGMGSPGGHHTTLPGAGETVTDATRPHEPGDDMSGVSVPDTLLNSLRHTGDAAFPLDIRPGDIEQYVTEADSRVAVAYCLDLSSTMRTKLGDGMSRIEAAKRALWILYTLNARHYPSDSVHVIGFASMACRIRPHDIPYLGTFTANDDFLHYTNYQAALRLARRILRKEAAENRRIVMITDGQPSACFVESERQRRGILSEKPYSHFYAPDPALVSRVEGERGLRLDADPGMQVYLCYRYRGVDGRVSAITESEARRCRRECINLDYVVISDEEELAGYVEGLAAETGGRSYWARDGGMTGMLVSDYVRGAKATKLR